MLLTGYLAVGLVYFGWAYANVGWDAWALFVVYNVIGALMSGIAGALLIAWWPWLRRKAKSVSPAATPAS